MKQLLWDSSSDRVCVVGRDGPTKAPGINDGRVAPCSQVYVPVPLSPLELSFRPPGSALFRFPFLIGCSQWGTLMRPLVSIPAFDHTTKTYLLPSNHTRQVKSSQKYWEVLMNYLLSSLITSSDQTSQFIWYYVFKCKVSMQYRAFLQLYQ